MRESNLYAYMLKPVRSDLEAHIRLEISGLWKSFGFPVIDTEQTAADFFNRMTGIPEVKVDAALEVRNMFRKSFCRSYLS